MPNPGGPFGGCDECRRKKVKCDQTYPACVRCIRRKVKCPGVKDKRTQIFRDETRRIVAKVEVREAQRQHSISEMNDIAQVSTPLVKPTTDGVTLSQANDVGLAVPLNSDSIQLQDISSSRPFYDPYEDLLAAFFFDQIVCPNIGWYAYLPPLYLNYARPSYLTNAVHSAALFVLANQQRDQSTLMTQARLTYSSAVTAVNFALGNDSERLRDEVLCTVLILNFIEDITGNGYMPCRAHIAGLQRLLRIRKSLGIKNFFGAEVWHSVAVRSQLLTLRSIHGRPYSEKILIPEMIKTPTLNTYDACENVRKFRGEVLKYIGGGKMNSAGECLLSYLIKFAKRLDTALQTCNYEKGDKGFSARWQRYTTSTLPDDEANAPVEYYKSVESAEVWNQHRCARICLHESLLELAEHSLTQRSSTIGGKTQHDLENIIAESTDIITQKLDDICGSIPFCLHRINTSGETSNDQSQRVCGGGALIWPLEVVLNCPLSSDSHRLLARETLREVGRSIGVRQALYVIGES